MSAILKITFNRSHFTDLDIKITFILDLVTSFDLNFNLQTSPAVTMGYIQGGPKKWHNFLYVI